MTTKAHEIFESLHGIHGASTGRLERIHPDIRVTAQENIAEFTLRGRVAFVPVTVTGLSRPDGFHLLVDGKPLDQSVQGNDFWQTDW